MQHFLTVFLAVDCGSQLIGFQADWFTHYQVDHKHSRDWCYNCCYCTGRIDFVHQDGHQFRSRSPVCQRNLQSSRIYLSIFFRALLLGKLYDVISVKYWAGYIDPLYFRYSNVVLATLNGRLRARSGSTHSGGATNTDVGADSHQLSLRPNYYNRSDADKTVIHVSTDIADDTVTSNSNYKSKVWFFYGTVFYIMCALWMNLFDTYYVCIS